MHKREFKLARTDKLTDLLTDIVLNKSWKKKHYTRRFQDALNVLMFDLDTLKKFNDTYGHVWVTNFFRFLRDNTEH